MKKLKDVDEGVIDDFAETAEILIEQHANDPKKALQFALAYCSGHYKQELPTTSLLTGRSGFSTIKMNVEAGNTLDEDGAREIIERFWAPRIANSIRTMKSLTDKTGVCFDLRAIDADGFMDNYHHLKESNARRVDFECQRITKLPDNLDSGNQMSGGNSEYRRGGGSGG